MDKINPNKLIPPKKEDTVTKSILSTLTAIHTSLKSISSILTFNKKFTKKEAIQKGKEKQKSERIEKETKKENYKPSFRIPKLKMPSMPRLGFFDFIKNFLMMAIFGFLFANLFKHLPKLKEILKVVTSVGTFLWKTVGSLLEGIVSFIDFSYDKFDSFRDATRSLLGEDHQKTFDKFTSTLNNYINLLLVGSLAVMGSGALSSGGGSGGPSKTTPGTSKPTSKTPPGKVTSSANRPRRSNPRVTGSVVDDVAQQAGRRTVAKGASKLLTKGAFVIGPLIDFGIRTLIFKEDVDRAAVGAISTGVGQAIGASLGGVIGGLAGSVVPIAGTLLGGGAGVFLGGLIGGFIGDWIGSSLYEMLKANQNKTPRIQKKESGGQVTRNGRPVGGSIKRSIKKTKKTPVRTITKKPNPGKNVGGIKEIVKLFPNPEDPKKRNPLKTLEFAANRFNADPLWGPVMGAAVSASMGEKVDKSVYANVSKNFGLLIQNMLDGYVDSNISSFNSNIMAMTEGGIIPSTRTGGLVQTSFGEKFGELMAKSFETMVNNSTNDIFQNIMKQYKLDDFAVLDGSGNLDDLGSPGGGDDGMGGGGEISSIDINGFSKEDIDALGRMVAAEAAGESPIGKAAVLAVILNRYRLIKSGQTSPGSFLVANKPREQITIRDILFAGGKGAGNQFSPYADGRFDSTSSTSGAAALASAIQAGGHNPEIFKQNLIKNAKLSEVDAEYVLRSVSFSNPNSRGSRPFNTREVLIGRHVFQQSPNVKLTGKIGTIDASVSSQVSNTNAANALSQAALSMKGFSTSKGPSSGNKACVWAVNQVFKQAGLSAPWGTSNYVPTAETSMIKSGYIRVKPGEQRPGDLYIVNGQGHIGIVLPNGNIISNSSSGAKFSWEASFSEYESYYGKGGRFYRIPSTIVSNKRPSGGSVPVGNGKNKLESDILAFRQFRTTFGAPSKKFATSTPRNYQIREIGVYGSGNYKIHPLADDTNYEIGVHKGEGHWENRAFDIPVPPSSKEGDMVAKFWRDRGYKVIWRSQGHYNHVHVEVPKNRVAEFIKTMRSVAGTSKAKPQSVSSTTITKPQQIATVPKSTTIPQQIAKWDTAVIPMSETIIATRIVKEQVPVPVPTPMAQPIFPGETANVNTDMQREMLAIG